MTLSLLLAFASLISLMVSLALNVLPLLVVSALASGAFGILFALHIVAYALRKAALLREERRTRDCCD
ncbi:MAG: hypothetical protein ACE5KH_00250 [Candidatus Geothermarchaeales archaeon]